VLGFKPVVREAKLEIAQFESLETAEEDSRPSATKGGPLFTNFGRELDEDL
jgi:hypothetical protein